jgi:hypothetical protein
MTEREWLTSTDPQPMLEFTQDRASDRKLRLFSCGCCRRIWHLVEEERSRNAVELAERFADGRASVEDLPDREKQLEKWFEVRRGVSGGQATMDDLPDLWPDRMVRNCSTRAEWAKSKTDEGVRYAAAGALGTRPGNLSHIDAWQVAQSAAGAVAWNTVGYARKSSEAAAWASAWNAAESGEFREQAALLRDIFGNPFATRAADRVLAEP